MWALVTVPASLKDCWPKCARTGPMKKGIGVLSQGNYFRRPMGGGGPVFELNRSLSLRLDVAYVHQSQQGMPAAAGNHVLVQASLDYRFRKNLGD